MDLFSSVKYLNYYGLDPSKLNIFLVFSYLCFNIYKYSFSSSSTSSLFTAFNFLISRVLPTFIVFALYARLFATDNLIGVKASNATFFNFLDLAVSGEFKCYSFFYVFIIFIPLHFIR